MIPIFKHWTVTISDMVLQNSTLPSSYTHLQNQTRGQNNKLTDQAELNHLFVYNNQLLIINLD